MELINTTPAGAIARSAAELSDLLALQVTITPDDMTAREAHAIRILHQERAAADKDRRFFESGSGQPQAPASLEDFA